MPHATDFRTDEAFALEQDAKDPLRGFRDEFVIPDLGTGKASIYLTGNSLGAMPRRVPELLKQETDDWAKLGVEGHVLGRDPWLPYHEQFRGPLSRLVGAKETEVVAMNSLTVNLHLLMATFYRPTDERFRIVIEDTAFPSDSYAVASQAVLHGRRPESAIVRLRPRGGESTLRTADIIEAIGREKPALVLLGAVNYLTGQWFDMPAITAAGHAAGAIVGWDLAHAAGNVPMNLHEWGADFAAWCSYKYLNGGPGAIAGAFVHERWHKDTSRPQLAGWWGNDPATRFKMGPHYAPVASADRWAVSNPPIFSLTPLKASLALYDKAGMPALRDKSLKLTSYMERLIAATGKKIDCLTPKTEADRGCQLSLVVPGSSKEMLKALLAKGVVCDFREPNVVRAAPVPLYNSFHDVWRFVQILDALMP